MGLYRAISTGYGTYTPVDENIDDLYMWWKLDDTTLYGGSGNIQDSTPNNRDGYVYGSNGLSYYHSTDGPVPGTSSVQLVDENPNIVSKGSLRTLTTTDDYDLITGGGEEYTLEYYYKDVNPQFGRSIRLMTPIAQLNFISKYQRDPPDDETKIFSEVECLAYSNSQNLLYAYVLDPILPFVPNTWHHLCARIRFTEDGKVELFRDGVKVAEAAGPNVKLTSNPSRPIFFGSEDPISPQWSGNLSNLRIHQRWMSDAEIGARQIGLNS